MLRCSSGILRSPPPGALVGQYDIVHVRNFAFVLQDPDIPRVLRNVVDLLKPGGYLQWGEADVSSFRIETVDSASKTDSLRRLLELSQSQDSRLAPTWVPNMPKLFVDAGLKNTISDVRDAPPYMAFLMHECGLMIHELVARQTGNQEVAKALQSLMAEVVEETKRGAWWAFTRWTVLATKS
ncbi:hypothetical protein KVR01_004726 [Diaporthe batatas]|uniref:uncharacterized protein n=1 Tax=Diaporthe batatas TaxID=748121 RepID=UPI001D0383BA|nr:uncharacterized protein KVR01_004726 [Diaporthe batatas]KAG8166174.1 hypothetical protein KVR01_004726 [Diaporthe batatas]